MSAPIAILLDATRVRAISSDGATDLLEVIWGSVATDELVRRLQATFGAPSAVVLVVGLGFLEIARPELPPLSDDARLALLRRDADRYFPLDGRVAIAHANGLAFATPSTQLGAWVRAFDAVGPVDAIFALPQACARALGDATYRAEAGDGEAGLVVIGNGTVLDARRIPARDPAFGRDNAARAIDLQRVLRTAISAAAAAPSLQLLDDALVVATQHRRRARVVRAAVVLAFAVVALAWSADRWRERELSAMLSEVIQLRSSASSAQLAAGRLHRAVAERGMLVSSDVAARAGNAPAEVLARLGAILPRDAFVQRLEYDGTTWRIDGSATDAPRIVPLLDADPRFADVRIVAASARFLDAGKQRESFSISFRSRPDSRGARGAK